MNNQITVLDRNGQPLSVELICYFSSGVKKYAFYTKNEMVQDGLIKMYVAEENNGLSNEITDDEWNNLKKIMQGIITGGTTDIQFLSYVNPLKLNEAKAIALNDANINSIKIAYKNKIESSSGETILNKDLLTQSFNANEETPVSTQEPVQISGIPQNQNTFNMEATPVNLNTNPVEEVSTNPFDSIPKIEPITSITETPSLSSTIPEIPSLNSNVNEPLSINNVKPSGIESGFKVSNEPNIFDQPIPFQITEEEINTPLNDVIAPVNEVSNVNIFSQPIENVSNNIIDHNENNKLDSSNNIDVDKKIALNERKIKLFEELASIYKEENELLKSENDSLENTASNLFNNNGTLNENEVLR